MFRKVFLLVFLWACLVSGRVNAAVFIYDDFDDGDIGANSAGDGSGFETTANVGGRVEENDGLVAVLGGTSGANRTQIGSKESFSANGSTVYGVFKITDMYRSQSVNSGTARFYVGFCASLPNGQGPIQGQTDGLWILLHGRYTYAGVDTWSTGDGGLIYNSGGTITALATWTWDPSVFTFDTASGFRSDRVAMDMIAPDLTCVLSSDAVGYSRLVRADEEGTLARLKALRRDLIEPKFAERTLRNRLLQVRSDHAGQMVFQ
ncbi:MAG: hypothetical protein IIA65_02070 [Planctomycetes bacterium]|nr:hypothetical protein [Planctomycetota bacterium]